MTVGRKHNNVKIIKFVLISLLLWMISPLFIPDDYGGYTGDERKAVEAALSEDDYPEIGPIQRFSVKEVTKHDSTWQVILVRHTLFNIPAAESKITVVRSCEYSDHTTGVFCISNINHTDLWLLRVDDTFFPIMIVSANVIIIIGIPILTVYYLIKFIRGINNKNGGNKPD